MTRGTFVYRDGELVEKSRAEPLTWGFLQRSDSVPCPMLNSDTADGFRSMADGKMYDSKSAYRASLRAHGMQEIGNEVSAHLAQATAAARKPPAKRALIEAYKKVRDGYRPPPAPIVNSIGTPDLD